ncbi:helix-turn-helix domain-containing protein [Pseudomonas marginalis]|uniref:Helix-turn-helix domain-containing protein n=1 Tax=Pseudomonas marginalis TaxID=298 RepID=A0A9X9BXG0_PSEMA|nr:helix-turn-helix domain-containing protein [Pseudomonas marginalis]TWR63016.1 helix-turn-helix domain-containing protein [Pseudomonas marginalis]SEB32178.1 Helix-turn-helix domain-containing protein [Pseudomonas marginalis]
MQIWTTEACVQRERFSYWREVLCEAFVSLNPILKQEPAGSDFTGEVSSRPLSMSAQTRVFSRAQFVQRRWDEIRRNPVEFCFANFQLEGSCVVRQDGQETLVMPGDFSVVDSTRPYFLDFREDWRVLSFPIPREQLVSRLAAPRQATARCVSGLIRELRLRHSARDLCSSGHPGVLAVALRWGFNDASHFSRLFKQRFGISPRGLAASVEGEAKPGTNSCGSVQDLLIR